MLPFPMWGKNLGAIVFNAFFVILEIKDLHSNFLDGAK